MMVASMSRAALDDEAERIELPVDLGPRASSTGQACRSLGEIARSRRSRASPPPAAGRKSGGTTPDRAPPPRPPDQRAYAIAAEERSGHRQRRIAWHARRRAMDRRKQILERRPVEPLLDPVQKSSNLAKSRSPSRLRRKLGTGHDAISAKHPVKLKPRESNPPHFCKNLRTGRTAFECDRGRAGGDLLPAFTSV
jgi:hypothetical protein